MISNGQRVFAKNNSHSERTKLMSAVELLSSFRRIKLI